MSTLIPPSLFAEDEQEFGPPAPVLPPSSSSAASASHRVFTGVVLPASDAVGAQTTATVVPLSSSSSSSSSSPSQHVSFLLPTSYVSRSLLRPAAAATSSTYPSVAAASVAESNIRAIVQKIYETQQSKAPELFERLCVRLVRDKISLERQIAQLKADLVSEGKIVSDLQTKLATFASTTFMAERQTARQVHVLPSSSSNNSTQPAVSSPQPPPAPASLASTSSSTAIPIADAGAEHNNNSAVGNLFRSVIDKVYTTTSTGAPATKTHGGREQTNKADDNAVDNDLSKQCDDLFKLNEELSMQIFEVKQSYEAKAKDLARAAQRRETQLLAEANSLREQLSIAQENHAREAKRASEQEKVFRESRSAVRQFEWLVSQLCRVDSLANLRFGAVAATSAERLTLSSSLHYPTIRGGITNGAQSLVTRTDHAARWQRASDAFQQLLDALSRRLNTSSKKGTAHPSGSKSNPLDHEQQAFHVRTLVQQWSHLEHLHAKCDSAAVRHRARSSMVHVLQQAASVVIPSLVAQILSEVYHPSSSSAASHSHPHPSSSLSPSSHDQQQQQQQHVQLQKDLIASNVTVLSKMSLHVCSLVSTWLPLLKEIEERVEQQQQQQEGDSVSSLPSSSSSSSYPVALLPMSLREPLLRICWWLRDMLTVSPSSVSYMAQQEQQRQLLDLDRNPTSKQLEQLRQQRGDAADDIDAAMANQNPFLKLVAAVLDALERLVGDEERSKHQQQRQQQLLNHQTAASVVNSTADSTRRQPHLAVSQLASRFLGESDPRHVFLSGALTAHQTMPAATTTAAKRSATARNRFGSEEKEDSSHPADHHEGAVVVADAKSSPQGAVPAASAAHFAICKRASTSNETVESRLLSQALADVDSLALQKEHLLLDRRQLSAKVESLVQANKQLLADSQRKAADYEDTVVTLHKQIEILSEALTQQQQDSG